MMTGVEGAGPTLEGVVRSGGRCGPAPTRSHVIVRLHCLPVPGQVASATLSFGRGDVNWSNLPAFLSLSYLTRAHQLTARYLPVDLSVCYR